MEDVFKLVDAARVAAMGVLVLQWVHDKRMAEFITDANAVDDGTYLLAADVHSDLHQAIEACKETVRRVNEDILKMVANKPGMAHVREVAEFGRGI